MCTNPVPISTSRHNFRQIVGCKGSLMVPCCHCADCVNEKINSIYQRAVLEYQHCIKVGGYVFWDTLTLNDDSLKYVDGKPYFPRRYLTLFLKRVRKFLYKLYGKDARLKFMAVAEYVSKGKKCRPHVHIIFFVYVPISPALFKSLINRSWHQYGFTDSIFHNNVLYSAAAIRYVIKYIEKWIEFVNLADEELNRDLRPFYQCSINMGIYDEYDFDGKLRIITKDGYQYQDPSCYYKTKLGREKVIEGYKPNGKPIYKKSDKGSYMYKVTDRGIYQRLNDLDTVIKNKVQQLDDCYRYLDIDDQCTVDDLMNGRSLHALAVYSVVYKGVRLSSLYDSPVRFQNYRQDYLAILTCQNEQVYADGSDLVVTPYSSTDVIRYLCDEDHPSFHDYDVVLSYLGKALHYYHESYHQKRLDEIRSRNSIKSILCQT